jgi:hypothetical protein
MKRKFLLTCWLLMCSVGFAHAHHSPATYDLTITDFAVTGKVKRIDFRNPHSHLVLEAPDKDGKMAQWEVEFSSVNLLLRRGWKLDRIKVGDTITCIGNPSKSGEPVMYMWSVKLSDGTVFAK